MKSVSSTGMGADPAQPVRVGLDLVERGASEGSVADWRGEQRGSERKRQEREGCGRAAAGVFRTKRKHGVPRERMVEVVRAVHHVGHAGGSARSAIPAMESGDSRWTAGGRD